MTDPDYQTERLEHVEHEINAIRHSFNRHRERLGHAARKITELRQDLNDHVDRLDRIIDELDENLNRHLTHGHPSL